VPYLDLTATRSQDADRVVVGFTNRHPLKPARLMVYLKSETKTVYRATEAWLMSGPGPLAANTPESPEAVGVRRQNPPNIRFGWMEVSMPPASLMVLVLERKRA
jgi:alpha-L-arabinofuranosidase